ncbi:hypothetical protein AX15_004064 [Amanita polypyramis BW_CC]|nr:hypothetical protein AX15_004064 [Amanita polypyramis BW_CC]
MLHDELLAHIFTLCCPRLFNIEKPLTRPQQLNISQVCSRWRLIALDTSALWNDVQFLIIDMSDKHVAIAQEWLSRAGKSPITFCRLASVPVPPIELLATFRLRSLMIYIESDELPALERLPDGTLSTLEKLTLCIPSTRVRLHLAKRLPALREVTLRIQAPELEAWDISLPWDQLEYLCLMDAPIRYCWDILRQCPSLTRCEIIAVHPSGPAPLLTDAPFSIPNLQKLYVSCSPLLEPLVLPHLHSLTIAWITPPGKRFQSTISTINAPVLRVLNVGRVDNRNGGGWFDGPGVLERAPSLQSIILPDTQLSPIDIARLSTGELGPNLQSIALLKRHDADDILTMMERRLDYANSDSHHRLVVPLTVAAFRAPKYKHLKKRIALLEGRGVRVYKLEWKSEKDLRWTIPVFWTYGADRLYHQFFGRR